MLCIAFLNECPLNLISLCIIASFVLSVSIVNYIASFLVFHLIMHL